jgi:hypothetical protein
MMNDDVMNVENEPALRIFSSDEDASIEVPPFDEVRQELEEQVKIEDYWAGRNLAHRRTVRNAA